MARVQKIYNRLLPLLQVINSGVSDTTALKSSYRNICDYDWSTNFALDKAFSRDLSLLVASNLITKNEQSIKPSSRLRRVLNLPISRYEKREILKIFIFSTHEQLIDGEHISTIESSLKKL
ncbi:MAG: hypothetical protein ACLFQJ_10940, partial [Campylobacterales bacterium]